MKKMFVISVIAVLLAITVTGCQSEEPEYYDGPFDDTSDNVMIYAATDMSQ